MLQRTVSCQIVVAHLRLLAYAFQKHFKNLRTEELANGHGGRRAGAGRPTGSGWKPHVANLRVAAVEQMQAILGSDRDPLAVVVGIACDPNVDQQTRLGAAAIALPYLYPRLSATQVQATHTTVKVDPSQLLDRIAERVARLAPQAAVTELRAPPPLIEGERGEAEE